MIRDLALPRRTASFLAEPRSAVNSLDEERFRALYEETAGRLRGYLRRVAGSAVLADDIAQEAYLRLLRARQGEGAPIDNAAFVFKIATNLTVRPLETAAAGEELSLVPAPCGSAGGHGPRARCRPASLRAQAP